MAKFRDSVRKSLMDYRDARAKRREVLGPDLIDTVGDIRAATGEAIKDTAETIAIRAMYGYDAVKDGFKSVVINLRDKVDNLQEKVSGFWNNFKDKMKNARDSITDKFTRGAEQVGLAKQKTVEDVHHRMGGFRIGLADRLNHVADVLRGEGRAADVKRDVETKVEEALNVKETPKVESKVDEMPNVGSEVVDTGMDDPDKKQVKVADAEDTPKEVQGLPEDLKDDFLRYYLQRQESVQKTFEHLDRQQRPPAKLKDYMIESGFAAFVEEIRGQSPELPERTLNQDGGGEFKELANITDKVLAIQEELMRNKMNQKEEFEDTTQGRKKSTKVEKDVDGNKKVEKPEKKTVEPKKTVVEEVKEVFVPELTKEELEEIQEHKKEQLNVDTSKTFEKETEVSAYGSLTPTYGPHSYYDGVELLPPEPEEPILTADDLSEFLNHNDMQL